MAFARGVRSCDLLDGDVHRFDVAVNGPPERERIVGTSCYYLSPATGLAEVGYMVDPDWQGVGLGRILHTRLVEYAVEHDVRGFKADVLVENASMLRVFQRAGHDLTITASGTAYEVTMIFRSASAEQVDPRSSSRRGSDERRTT
jgi:RimJ/RimL family protein N-acetyltransferase